MRMDRAYHLVEGSFLQGGGQQWGQRDVCSGLSIRPTQGHHHEHLADGASFTGIMCMNRADHLVAGSFLQGGGQQWGQRDVCSSVCSRTGAVGHHHERSAHGPRHSGHWTALPGSCLWGASAMRMSWTVPRAGPAPSAATPSSGSSFRPSMTGVVSLNLRHEFTSWMAGQILLAL